MDNLIDFSFPEDVLIQVEYSPREAKGWRIAQYKVINETKFIGAASYEKLFGLLHYVFKDILVKPEEGYHIVTNVSADFGLWLTDWDIQFNYQSIHSITESEYHGS